MKTHSLKCHPHFFQALSSGDKNFEIRRNDRNYQKGDHLLIREYDPSFGLIPGDRILPFLVTYVMNDEDFPGILPGFVIMGIRPLVEPELQLTVEQIVKPEHKIVNKRCNEYKKLAGEPYGRSCPVHGIRPCV